MNTKRLTVNGMLAAMCAVLGYLSVDLGNIKITFESLPILLGALLFGPVDGMFIGGIGTLTYQLLRYGVTVTTPLWILPYVLCGLFAGLIARRRQYSLSRRQTAALVTANELMITILNTGVIYVDSKIFGYFTPAYIYGSLAIRFVICFARAAAFSLVLPVIITALRKTSLVSGGESG